MARKFRDPSFNGVRKVYCIRHGTQNQPPANVSTASTFR